MSTNADLPPYEPSRILGAPFPERVRLVCRSWAAQVSPTPRIVMAMYWTKYLLLYVGGWNFGDGHLNHTQLLEAAQAQCGFEPGELRVVMVESQPLFGRAMQWQIVDAASGVLEQGETLLAPMRAVQPWPTGRYAKAFERGRPAAGA